MENTVQLKIIDLLKPKSEGLKVADVRIGLGYTSVRLDNGNTGLAWTGQSLSGSCPHQSKAGSLAGSSAQELLGMLGNDFNPLSRSIGLATANALVAGLPHPVAAEKDVLDMVDIKASDRVVMVGFFGPVIPGLKKTGCKLDILELKSEIPGTLSMEEGKESLSLCSVAIITATSIITGTLEKILAGLGTPRAVIMLGPSTIMYPPVFSETAVTHISGAWVKNAAAVEKIVSEGGGTMILKPYLKFDTICL